MLILRCGVRPAWPPRDPADILVLVRTAGQSRAVTHLKPYAVLLVLALAGCGSGDDGDSGLGVHVISGPVDTAANVPFQIPSALAMVPGNGEFSVFWSEFGTQINQWDFDLDLQHGAALFGGITAGIERQGPAACRSGNSVTVAWTHAIPFDDLPPGPTPDRTNILATFSWPDDSSAEPIHSNTIGEQTWPSAACTSDGSRAITWQSSCVGTKRQGNDFIRYTPDECAQEPEDGTYLRMFAEDGTPRGEMRRVANSVFGGAPIAGVDSDRFVLLAGSQIEVLNSDGEVVDTTGDSSWLFTRASLSCAGERCAAAVAGSLWAIDSTDLDSTSVLAVAEHTQPSPDVEIDPQEAAVACDPNGICLATWLLIKSTFDEDVVYSESLGVFGRAVDLRRGTMGEPALIVPPAEEQHGVSVVAAGPGQFAIADFVTASFGGTFLLRRIDVD